MSDDDVTTHFYGDGCDQHHLTDDVTIPREDAQRLVRALRARHMDDLADILDPPQPSLRDEVLLAIDPTNGGGWEGEADAVLAVVRKHIEAMPVVSIVDGVAGVTCRGIDRDDVLALLGGDDD